MSSSETAHWVVRNPISILEVTGNENVTMLVEVMTYVDEHTEQLDQTVWTKRTPCGTVACIAGHTMLMLGWTPWFPVEDEWREITSYFVDPDGDRHYTETAAMGALGLNLKQAELLFHYKNNLVGLRKMVSVLTQGTYVPPDKRVEVPA